MTSQEEKMDIDTEIFAEYAELERDKKAIEMQQKNLKEQMDTQLKAKNIDHFKLDGVGMFYYTKRQTWEYDETIKAKEAAIQTQMQEKLEEVHVLKKEFEEKNDPKVTLSLSCRVG